MAYGMEIAMVVAAVIGAGASVYSSQSQAATTRGVMEAEARAKLLEAKQADLQTTQISAKHLQELNANLGAIAAMRAGKNLLGDSPTSEAIVRSFTRESLGARANDMLDARLRAYSARNAMAAAGMQARGAQRVANFQSIGAIAQGFGNAYSATNGFSFLRSPNGTTRTTGGGS